MSTPVHEIRIATWSELQSKLYEGSWQRNLHRFRSPFAFRGVSDAACDPATSLSRLGGEYHRREISLLRNFRKYAYRNVLQADSLWNWIALGQHYGLPTRLLDWTFSPYVALHFATVDDTEWDREAAIWCVDCVKIKNTLPRKLKSSLKSEDSDVLTIEMLDSVAPTLQAFESLSHRPFVAFFEPPSLDDRIINQAALFSVTSSANLNIRDWLSEHKDLFHRIVIPPNLKREIRDKLDQANVNERILFPGLDGLTPWLTRYYSPSERTKKLRDGTGPGVRRIDIQASRYSG